jgi:glycosyltransferase involved in cell wall biosynthesis
MISVIIVTYNRALLLEQCIESILAQDVDTHPEIILVDNGSTDGTEGLVKERFPGRLRYLKNPSRLSLNESKLIAVHAATGDTIAFVDDDCVVAPDWLSNIADSLAGYEAAAGAVLPMKGTQFPRWWRQSMNWLIGINPQPGLSFLPLGSNTAFKRQALETINKGFTFDARSCHNLLPYAEDNYRIQEALRRGYSLRINSAMAVYHRVPPERLKISYLIQRSFREGESQVCVERKSTRALRCFFGIFYHGGRMLLTLDYGLCFRMLSCISYLLHYVTIKHAQRS